MNEKFYALNKFEILLTTYDKCNINIESGLIIILKIIIYSTVL